MITKYIRSCIAFNGNEIYKLIQMYWRETGKIPNYLVMSEETAKLIKEEYDKTFKQVFERANNLEFCQYCGIAIETCDRLKFGEIEVV